MAYIPKLPPIAAKKNSTAGSHMDKTLVTRVTPVIPIRRSTKESDTITPGEVSGLLNQWLREKCLITWRCASNVNILRREFHNWARLPLSCDGAIVEQLRRLGFTPDEDAMVSGLALA